MSDSIFELADKFHVLSPFDEGNNFIFKETTKPIVVKGYWGDVNGKSVHKYYYGEVIYYWIETKNAVDGSNAVLRIFERDDIPYTDEQVSGVYTISISSNKGSVAVLVDESWNSIETKNKEKVYNRSSKYAYKEELRLFGKISLGSTSKLFRDNLVKFFYPLQEQGLKDGVGDVEDQQFDVQVVGTKDEFEVFKTLFTTTPEKITTNKMATYVPFDKNNDGILSEGDQIDIDISGPFNGSVKVSRIITEEDRFEVYLHALEGHPDAGNIRFSGQYIDDHYYPKDSKIIFEIYNRSRVNVPLGLGNLGLFFRAGSVSRTAQVKQWKNVLANFCNELNKKPYSATFHLIKREWDSKLETPGKISSNDPQDITQEVEKLQTTPNTFWTSTH